MLHWVMCEEEVDILVCKDNLNLRNKDMGKGPVNKHRDEK